MRISDWSSDVCSSDLARVSPGRDQRSHHPRRRDREGEVLRRDLYPARGDVRHAFCCRGSLRVRLRIGAERLAYRCRVSAPSGRSEEHTSELQSLMRISYAVLCLKTKILNTTCGYSKINNTHV